MMLDILGEQMDILGNTGITLYILNLFIYIQFHLSADIVELTRGEAYDGLEGWVYPSPSQSGYKNVQMSNSHN